MELMRSFGTVIFFVVVSAFVVSCSGSFMMTTEVTPYWIAFYQAIGVRAVGADCYSR